MSQKSLLDFISKDYIAVEDNWTVQKVLTAIRRKRIKQDRLEMVYVVDDKGRLIDDIHSKDFLIYPLRMKISQIRDDEFIALNVSDAPERAIHMSKKHKRASFPVIDENGFLVGCVTISDLLEITEYEHTDDMHKLGAIEVLDESYVEIPIFRMIQKRASWLVILFLSEMLTATAMAFFENEIAKAVVLALFVPLIISSGGNSGSQATTLIIRSLALGEIKLKDWFKVLRRELVSGFSLGCILGLIGFLRIALWSMMSNIYGPNWFYIALTVCLSLIFVVLWGSLVGSMLPFILKRLGFDPATSSAPFVATLVDVTGLLIYFGIALITLKGIFF